MTRKYLYPLISCICITDNRPEFLLKAVIYYDSQNYPNRELVISYPKNDTASKHLIEEIKAASSLNILVIEREVQLSIGAARNQAVEKCNGEYICTWDDDDFHREVRLMYQLTCLRSVRQKREASILTHVILYDLVNDHAYLSTPNNWVGTLLCKKELVLQHPYTNSDIDEGSDLINFLQSSLYLHHFSDYNLYTYIYHGTNSHSADQFFRWCENSKSLDQASKAWLSSQINKRIAIISS